MKASIKAKIDAALAAEQLKSITPALPMAEVGLLVDRILNGEKQWEIKELSAKSGLSYNSIIRRCKGRIGYRKDGHRVFITDSLARQVIAESLLAGLKVA